MPDAPPAGSEPPRVPLRSRRQPTITDVARRAGVSHQTVSRVLNDPGKVRTDTAERVRAAVVELGYRRNRAAQLLASRRSGLVGAAVFGASQLGPQRVLLSLEDAAAAAGYQLAARTIREPTVDAITSAVDDLLAQGVEAVVLIVPHESATRFARSAALDVPVVLTGAAPSDVLSSAVRTVHLDNVLGARLATRHLLELGHPTVVHVAGPPGWVEAAARVEGWREELLAWGRPVPPLRWGGDWTARSGHAAGVSLAREDDVTAVFVANDQMALGLIAAIRQAGRDVPRDLSVVGFDDIPEVVYTHPALTTVRQDFAALGEAAMTAVRDALSHDRRPSAACPPAAALLPVLVPRDSVAPPPRPVVAGAGA